MFYKSIIELSREFGLWKVFIKQSKKVQYVISYFKNIYKFIEVKQYRNDLKVHKMIYKTKRIFKVNSEIFYDIGLT